MALLGAGLLLALAGLALPWHDVIIYPGFRALAMPLWGEAFLPPPLAGWGTYGTAILGLLLLAGMGWHMQRPVVLFWAACLLLLLAARAPLQIAFSQPSWLEQFLLCRDQYLNLTTFSNRNEMPNMAQSIAAADLVSVEDPQERWNAALVSLRVGWCLVLAGGGVMMAGALLALEKTEIKKQGARALVLALVLAACPFARPVAGEFCWRAGERAEREGEWDRAEAWYRTSLWMDDWNRRVVRVYKRLGAVAAAKGERSAEHHFWEGCEASRLNALDEAMDRFMRVLSESADEGLRRQAGLQYADAALRYGQRLYTQGGAGAAVAYFKLAARYYPVPVAADYMAGFCLRESGQYEEAQKYLDRAIEGGTTSYLQAHSYTQRGDVKTLRHQVPEGRIDYLESLELDDDYNVRAQKALTDNLTP